MRFPISHAAAAALLFSLLVAGCSTATRRVSYEPEGFDSTTTHTRTYVATEAQTCEAARRALLSQGYMITAGNHELVTGRKSFQPASEVHVEVEFRVVCARESNGRNGPRSTIAFASALQDRYGIKKVNNSATVGVGAIGSLSLPFSSSDDALVKVASETLTDERFYDRFFALIERFLPEAAEESPAEARPVLPQQPPIETPLRDVPLSPTRG
ncbi:DUF2242 domain-containing protein [Variovorax sp. GT1P44]|uniref:DUF2242 domain-containing protein n=1 Tax=Variovorax sp. GT1P44 TaxID=3443742 RepID=UPI003F4528B8